MSLSILFVEFATKCPKLKNYTIDTHVPIGVSMKTQLLIKYVIMLIYSARI
jgi:hypothetical protein